MLSDFIMVSVSFRSSLISYKIWRTYLYWFRLVSVSFRSSLISYEIDINGLNKVKELMKFPSPFGVLSFLIHKRITSYKNQTSFSFRLLSEFSHFLSICTCNITSTPNDTKVSVSFRSSLISYRIITYYCFS